MSSENSPSFAISGLGSTFAARQRDLFACLDAADKEREGKPPCEPLPVRDEEEDDHRVGGDCRRGNPAVRSGRRTKQYRGKESIFKRPELPAPRRAVGRNSVADHQRNPHKYTKYSLGDVSPQDMSDRSNTAAALSFLQELRARKDSEDPMDVTELPKAIVFKPTRAKTERHTTSLGAVSSVTTVASSEEADRPSFRSSKLVMPEYVVGQKKASKKKGSSDLEASSESGKKSRTKEVTLGHLMDEEDE